MSSRVVMAAVWATWVASLCPVACGSNPEPLDDVDGAVVDAALPPVVDATPPPSDAAPPAPDSGPSRCASDDDCTAQAPRCETTRGACVECLGEADCAVGTRCDLVRHACALGCAAGTADCDGDPANDCEHDLAAGKCACIPGATDSCYDGPAGTVDVGACAAGSRTCMASGLAWGACETQVVPVPEVCANGVDEDCNGTADDVADADGDGWTRCDGDCCDSVADGCTVPADVNPGAFEVVGNGFDDDCRAVTADADPSPACSTDSKLSGVEPFDAARAIDLCQFTTANPSLSTRSWGVITAEWRLASGSVPTAAERLNMTQYQAAILQDYGTGGVVPRTHPTMLGLSTGRMRDQNDPGYVAPANGTQFNTAGAPPAAYLAAHGGQLPSSNGCSGTCPIGSGANDSINLRLTIRVPTNARSFSYAVRYFTAEYWAYACTPYNDFFLALINSSAAGLPADRNLSFDSLLNPLSVNNSFFESCVPKGCFPCPAGTGQLEGTGMRDGNTGGGTRWLTTSAPVVPGETMTLDFMIFDVSDYQSDSNALLDDFRWSTQPSAVTTQ